MQYSLVWKEVNSSSSLHITLQSDCIWNVRLLCFAFEQTFKMLVRNVKGLLDRCMVQWWWGTLWGWFFSWLELNHVEPLLNQRYCSNAKWEWKDSQAWKLSAGCSLLLTHFFSMWGAQNPGTVPIGHVSWWQKGNEEVPLPCFLC